MNDSWLNLITFAKQRIFINVAYSGCGSGCLYCYEKTSSQKQELASYEDLRRIAQFILSLNGMKGCIISFCPNTEPFKSEESTKRVLFVIGLLQGKSYRFQISTKEYIPDEVLLELNSFAVSTPIFIDISVPYLNNKTVEPGAANIEQRMSNVKRIHSFDNLKCSVYIKPFTREAMGQISSYIDLINASNPDYICIGVRFNHNENKPCLTLYDVKCAMEVIHNQGDDICLFANELFNACIQPVVFSSVCAVARFTGGRCTLRLWEYKPRLCDGCELFHRNEGV